MTISTVIKLVAPRHGYQSFHLWPLLWHLGENLSGVSELRVSYEQCCKPGLMDYLAAP